MCPQEIRILNSLDRKIDESSGRMGLGEMRTYRRLLIRFVEDASRVERRPGRGRPCSVRAAAAWA